MTPHRLETLLADLGSKIERRPSFSAITVADKTPSTVPLGGYVPINRFTRPHGLSAPLNQQPPPIRERVLTPAEVTSRLTASLASELHSTTLKIYRALHETALHVARARGYAPKVSQVSFHIPAEIIAHALLIHRSTLYRRLEELEARGLVDARGHYTTYNGRTVSDGTVWSVKIDPDRASPARVRYDDLKHKWRDLAADIDVGRTAYAFMRQSKIGESNTSAIEVLVSWTLPQLNRETSLPMTVASGPEAVLDVPYASRAERGKMVDLAARSVCQYLGDDSINFYRYLFWNLLRLHDRGQSYFEALHLMILRAGADHREGFARSAGALLVSRLKRWEVWDLIRSVPPWSVGTAPVAV